MRLGKAALVVLPIATSFASASVAADDVAADNLTRAHVSDDGGIGGQSRA